MAKNKKSKSRQQQPQMSPERFLREKARTLPIEKCYITSNWKEAGISQIIISRLRPSGNRVVGVFLVDTFCVGVKSVKYYTNMTEYEYAELIERFDSNLGLEEIPYDEAHNIIYGAIAFAEEGGIEPAKEFTPGQYILEEDTDDIPLIDYEFGKDGKHFLVMGPSKRDMPYFYQLKKTLGDDFKYLMGVTEESVESSRADVEANGDDESYDAMLEGLKEMAEEMRKQRYPQEEYSYRYPPYPGVLSVENQFIVSELMDPDHYNELPREVIERILALPPDEAAEDLSRLILFEIGLTCYAINDDTIEELENTGLLHAILILTQLSSEKGLKAILEILRQNSDFADYHFGDLAPEILHPALYACGLNRVSEIEDYINEPGLDNYLKSEAFSALTMIAILHPERREEIIEVFRRILHSWVTKLPIQKSCDGMLAGLFMSNLIDLRASELIPEIKAVFATGCVDKAVAGDCAQVVKEIKQGWPDVSDKYKFPDIYSQYSRLKSFDE